MHSACGSTIRSTCKPENRSNNILKPVINNLAIPETQIGRWKSVIGPKLKARNLENQKTEVMIGVDILNKMTNLGRPDFAAVG